MGDTTLRAAPADLLVGRIEFGPAPQSLPVPAGTQPLVAFGTLPWRERIERLEAAMLDTFEQRELPVRHHFSKGVYARELFIPAGTVLTGKVHKFTNLNIISAGDISILTENGVVRLRAPHTLVSPPGTKRVGYAHADTVWTTIHGTELTDLDEIERVFVAQSYDEYLAFCEAAKREGA